MRILLLILLLLGAQRLVGQAIPYQDPETGLWGVQGDNQKIDARYDSVTAFGWNYESTYFLWWDGEAYIYGPSGSDGDMYWLNPNAFDSVLYDTEGSMCMVRTAVMGDWWALATEADRRDGEYPFLWRLPPIIYCRFDGEYLWLKSWEKEALMHDDLFRNADVHWYARVDIRRCGEEPAMLILQDRRGRYAITDMYTDADFIASDLVPLGTPCERKPYWLTLRDGTHALADPEGYCYPIAYKELRLDSALWQEEAFKKEEVVPFYRTDAQGQRWYGSMNWYEQVVPPIFPLAYFREAAQEPFNMPADNRDLRRFQPAKAGMLKTYNKLLGCVLTDARGKATWIATLGNSELYPAAFVVDEVPAEQAAFAASWGQFIVGSRVKGHIYYGVLDMEGAAVIPPRYDSITMVQLPDGTWAYQANRDGTTQLMGEEGEVLEQGGE